MERMDLRARIGEPLPMADRELDRLDPVASGDRSARSMAASDFRDVGDRDPSPLDVP